MKYDKRKIMRKAWATFKKGKAASFAESLHFAWCSAKNEEANARRIEAAKASAGVTENTETWTGWKSKGYEVRHGSRAAFQCDLMRGNGQSYRASFFTASQVQARI